MGSGRVADRKLIVQVIGDASSLRSTFKDAEKATKDFGRQISKATAGSTPLDRFSNVTRVKAGLEDLARTQAKLNANLRAETQAHDQADAARRRSIGSLLGISGAGVIAYQALQRVRDALLTTGDAAFTTEGRIRNVSAALLSGDIIGAFEALAKTETNLAPDLEKALENLRQIRDEASRITLQDVIDDSAEFSAKTSEMQTGMRALGLSQGEVTQETEKWVGELRDAAAATVDLGAIFESVFTGITAILEDATRKTEKAIADAAAARDKMLTGKATLPPGFGAAIAREKGPEGSEEGQLKVLRAASANLDKRIADLRKMKGPGREAALRKAQEEQNAINAQIDAILRDRAAAAERQKRLAEEAARKAKAAAEAAIRAQREAFAEQLAFLDIKLDRAKVTRGLQDDLAALAEQEKAIREQIKIEGRTAALVGQLAVIERDRAAINQERKDRARAAVQAGQFKALGLTAEGEEKIPTAANLKKRLGSISEAIKGTPLDTDKTRSMLERFRRVLAGEFGKITEETREFINNYIKALSGDLDVKKGPLTKTSGLNTKKFLEGLGLTPEQEAEARSRLSGLNSAGRQLAGNVPASGRGGGFAGGPPIVVQSTTNLILDGVQIARAVTRNTQKNDRRNPRQKRGMNKGGGV